MTSLDNKKLQLDRLWRYFELHANQRISLFRYYILFFSLYATTTGYLIVRLDRSSNNEEILLSLFSLAFISITVIFWLIDNRNRFLIKLSERLLRKAESEETDEKLKYHEKIFCLEDRSSKNYLFRHTCCFRLLYLIAIITSVFLFFYSFNHLLCKPASSNTIININSSAAENSTTNSSRNTKQSASKIIIENP